MLRRVIVSPAIRRELETVVVNGGWADMRGSRLLADILRV